MSRQSTTLGTSTRSTQMLRLTTSTPGIRWCELERQIDSQAVEIGHTRTGYVQSRREEAPLHEELADRERALRDSRVRSIEVFES